MSVDMRHFEFAHLPERLQAYSKPFAELARWVHGELPPCSEKSAALRKILEAKDCAVRAAVEFPNLTKVPRQRPAAYARRKPG